MSRPTLHSLLLAFVLLSACAKPAPPPDPALDRIQRIENGLLPSAIIKGEIGPMKLTDRMDFYKVPGVSIAVIHDGKLEWAKAYGVVEAGSNNAVTTETLFQAASLSHCRFTQDVKRSLQNALVETLLDGWIQRLPAVALPLLRQAGLTFRVMNRMSEPSSHAKTVMRNPANTCAMT